MPCHLTGLFITQNLTASNLMIVGAQLYPLLSPLVDSRIYPIIVPEGSVKNTPYIVWQVISNLPENTIDGATGHEWVRVQIDCYDPSYDAAVQLSNDVLGVINSNIQTTDYFGTQQMYDTDAKLFRQSIDIGLWQTTPSTYL